MSPSDPAEQSSAAGEAAVFFDGRTAAAVPVVLGIGSGRVRVTGDTVERDELLAAVDISQPLGSSPRIVRFPDGSFCEVAAEPLRRMLAREGIAESRLARSERAPWLVPIALAVIVVLAVAGYRWGVPLMARVTAERLSPAVLDGLSERMLGVLDEHLLEPSELTVAERQALLSWAAVFQVPGSGPLRHRIEFRKSEVVGPNAFALPSGTVVVTDALVRAMDGHHLVMAVISHELGHVYRRHGLRNMIQSSIVSLVLVWYVGDVSNLVATAPAWILQARYSREFEREADAYAAEMLRLNGFEPALLADALERIERAAGDDGGGSRVDAASAMLSYLSTHPATAERAAYLRQ